MQRPASLACTPRLYLRGHTACAERLAGDSRLSAAQLQRGARFSDNVQSRLSRLAARMRYGENISVVSLGTSITYGHGIEDPARIYRSLLATWIRQTTNATVQEHVSAEGSFNPSTIEHCVSSQLLPRPDLVLVEYAVMPDFAGMERLLRRLLRHHACPAIIMINTPSFELGPTPLPVQTPEGVLSRKQSLDMSVRWEHLAAHYHVPIISLWPAIADAVLKNDSRFQLEELFFESVHPTAVGHALLAQLLGHMLLSARHAAAVDGTCAPVEAPLPVAFFGANRAWVNSTPPEARCVMGDELTEWVAGGDWRYVVEGNASKKQHPKPGWVSSGAPTSTLALCRPDDRRNLSLAAARGAKKLTHLPHGEGAARAVWKVAHLQSYTADMGSVELRCTGKCACKTRTLRGWLPPPTNPSGFVTGEPPPRVSTVVTTSIRVKRRAGGGGGGAARGCGCLVRLRLVTPSEGVAPYHAHKLERRHPHRGGAGGSSAIGLKFKLVGLAVMDGDDNSFARNAVFHVEPGWSLREGGVAVMGSYVQR